MESGRLGWLLEWLVEGGNGDVVGVVGTGEVGDTGSILVYLSVNGSVFLE